MRQLKNIIRQPLLHFLFIGAFLFALYYLVNPIASRRDTILIDDEQVSRMISVFEKEWGRQPTNIELKGLLDRFIQTEVYYRKALMMNLDHNDEIIKRRLDQKLRFVTNDLATLKDPTDEELKSYYNARKKKYHLPEKYSFTHIYFNPDKRENILKDARIVLASLPANDTGFSELAKKGDAFPFSYHILDITEKEIAREMGDAFADTLKTLPIHQWTGPVGSGYGMHLLYIREKKAASEPLFSQIKEDVLKDYQYDLQQEYNDRLYKDFKKDFNITLQITDPKLDKNLLHRLIEMDEKR